MVTLIKRYCRRSACSLFLAITLCTVSTPSQSNALLSIQPQIQQTPEWCWATVGQMIFQYYNVPNIGYGGDYQCGIVALYGAKYDSFTGQWSGPCLNNCFNCIMGAGQFQTIQGMLYQYPQFANYFTNSNSSRPISSIELNGPLAPNLVVSELNAGRPIIAAVTPGIPGYSGPPAHVTLLVGYVQQPSGEFDVIVNDPFPYPELLSQGMPDPYIQAGGEFLESGRYQIEIDSFQYNLSWTQTGYGIVPAQSQPPPTKKSDSGGGGLFGWAAVSGLEVTGLATMLLLSQLRRRS